MDGKVFINYRGGDSHSYGALLYVELTRHLGPGLVFLDSESVPAGVDFGQQLLGQVRCARALLAVIGAGWLTAGNHHRPRLREQADWTHRELAEAFATGVRVIPVLAEQVRLPTRRELPEPLAPLTRCQARRLRLRELATDIDRILRDLLAGDPELALTAARRSAARAGFSPATRQVGGRLDRDRPGLLDPGLLPPRPVVEPPGHAAADRPWPNGSPGIHRAPAGGRRPN